MIRSKYEIACTRCKPRSTQLGLSRIDCSTYAQENHSRCNGTNYCFSQAKCGVMNHKLISTANRRVKVNNRNSGRNFHRSPSRWISSENENRHFPFASGNSNGRIAKSSSKIKSSGLSFFLHFYRDNPCNAQERLAISIIICGWP